MGRDTNARPWLAVLLGLLATGLGHLYLRRWARAAGWFLAAVASALLFVPPEAAEALATGGRPSLGALAPALAVSGLSIVDAYLIARRARAADAPGDSPIPQGRLAGSGPDPVDGDAGPGPADGSGTVECPHCGRETERDLEFCQWCAEELPGAGDGGG